MPDFTFMDPEGTRWASEHEYRVFAALTALGAPVRRSVQGSSDTFDYAERKQRVTCLDCGSTKCVQARSYTPDLHIASGSLGDRDDLEGDAPGDYWIEAKGYFRPDKRKLFRAFRKARPDVDIRLVVQSNHRIGKGNVLTWAHSYAKVEAWVWNWKKDDITDVVPPHWVTW